MTTESHFEEEPAETRAAIMYATYHALCEHGYANLTMQKIGDEFSKSKSLVYHLYDGKDELLLDFLEFMLDRFEADVVGNEPDDAAQCLETVLDHLLPDSVDPDRASFRRALIELRAQAAHDQDYRDHFTRSDQLFHERLAGMIRDGIDQGVFRDVDPDRVASLLLTTIDGALLRAATADDPTAMRATREELAEYVESRLLADPAP